jgi:hypothetical protein
LAGGTEKNHEIPHDSRPPGLNRIYCKQATCEEEQFFDGPQWKGVQWNNFGQSPIAALMLNYPIQKSPWHFPAAEWKCFIKAQHGPVRNLRAAYTLQPREQFQYAKYRSPCYRHRVTDHNLRSALRITAVPSRRRHGRRHGRYHRRPRRRRPRSPPRMCSDLHSPRCISRTSRLRRPCSPCLRRHDDDTDYDPNPQYSFAYDIQDALTGDSKGQ